MTIPGYFSPTSTRWYFTALSSEGNHTETGHVTWLPLLKLLSWQILILSSHCKPFEIKLPNFQMGSDLTKWFGTGLITHIMVITVTCLITIPQAASHLTRLSLDQGGGGDTFEHVVDSNVSSLGNCSISKCFYLNSWRLPSVSMMAWCWIIDMIIKYVSTLYYHVSSISSSNWVYYMA